MMCETNSREYWNDRFSSKHWDDNGGKEQTLFFAQVACSLFPEFLKEDLQNNNWSVVDVGCAQGEGTAYFADQFPSCHFIGQDFSDAAIQTAKEAYSNCEFMVGNAYEEIPTADIIYSSNTLEHLNNPQELMLNMCKSARKYVVHLLPFEDPLRIAEHINIFSHDAFPLRMGSFYLEYFTVFDCNELESNCWPAKQILLVYTNSDYRPEDMTLLNMKKMMGVEGLEQRIAGLEEDLRYSWRHADMKVEAVKSQLEERNRDLLEEIKMLENKLQESEQLSAEQIATLKKELEVLTQQLDDEKTKYENLYAYSCKRDDELISITNSRSYQFFVKWLKKPMSITYRIARKFYHVLKALVTLNFSALKMEIGGPVKKVHLRLKGFAEKRKAFAALKNTVKGRRVVILPPTLDWHMPLFQRPQQLAASYARKENTVVIYLTKNIQYDAVPAVEKINSNLWLVNELFVDKLPDIVKNAAEVILSVSWTPNKKYLDILHPDKFIYEYIDELEIFHMYGPEMEADHQRLMRDADVTICTATKLYNQAAGIAKNPLLSPNAGDYEFFAKTDEYEISPWISEIVKDYKCVLGYYGALASWFDYELVKTVAAEHPDWLFVLVGIDYDGTIGKSGVDKYPNIVHVPPQPYKALPSFLKGFDIATIPFVINEITLSTSPVKLFEYMASGRPIMSSKMPECLKYESVKTYANAEEFCSIVENYMAMKSDDKYWDVLKKEALENTWDARTDEILAALS